MPRDGSDVYNVPSGTHGVVDSTIESARYNAFVDDVAQDLNHPRPVLAGGTGSANTFDALTTLGGEFAKQSIINYDSDTFLPGSFYSGTSAITAPVAGHAFAGICYQNDASNLVLEARDHSDTQVPGRKYVREKKAGVWGPWTLDGRTITGGNEGIGASSGDMFFGVSGVSPNSLFIVNNKADATGISLFQVLRAGPIYQNAPVGSSVNFYYNTLTASGVGVNLWGMKAASPRWLMQLGNEAAESGGNVGSDFVVGRFSDAGGNLGATFTINRSTGLAAFAANLQVNGAAGISGALGVNGTLTTNQITANGDIYAMSGVVRFRDAGKYLYHDGTNFNLVGGGTFTVNGNLTSTATVSGAALSISGAATIAGTVTGGALSTAGAVTGASLSISGAATIGGNLAVTGRVSGDGSVPPGAIMDFGMPAAPAGWTPCDGGAISRVTYAALFAAIGTTWGAGDGSSTFNVPQLISRFRRHRDNGSLAGTVGTLKSPANLAHTHPGITGIQDADHTHAQQGTLSTQTINGGLYPNAVSHTHSVGTVFVGTNNFGAGAGGVDVPATHTGLTIGATNTDHAHNFILSGQTGGASASHHHGFTTDGGSADDPSEARPYSAAVLTCIKL